MGNLTGKTAVVTGSTSGIGLAYARAFAGAGANIVLNGMGDAGRHREGARRYRDRFQGQGGAFARRHDQAGRDRRNGRARRKDVRRASTSSSTMPASSTWRRSRSFRPRSGKRSSRSTCRRRSTRIRAAVPGHEEARLGPHHQHRLPRIRWSPRRSSRPMSSAKHGIAGLTKTVALELATFGITCNCICPGYVWTPLVEKQIPDTMKARNLTEEQVDQRRAAGGAADQAVRHGRAGRGAGAVPLRR